MCRICSPNAINPIQCIVPPHMLEVLAMRGDAATQAMAREMLAQDSATRAERAGKAGAASMQASAESATGFKTRSARAAADGKPKRRIHDGQRKAALPGKLVRSEGDAPVGDAVVNEAYDGAGSVYDLYLNEFARDSVDGAGMPLVHTVHHRKKYNNAFWDGSQMAYGDGDGVIFSKFTELSVIAHEMSHGVVQFSGGLQYEGESGALNESFADVFGALTLQRAMGQDAHQADWLIGKGILGPNINGVALRSMKAPGTAYADAMLGQDPQPYHMDFFVTTTSDNGGVHINSGIPNHAFYLYAQYIGGQAWKKPGKVWYDTMQQLNNPLAGFAQWAVLTIDVANGLFGVGSMEAKLLRRSWKLVGIAV